MEIELKLVLDPADVIVLRRHPLLKQYASGRPLTRQLDSIYFDTPDFHLRRHDAGLRVRRAGKAGSAWTQNLKASGQIISGLQQRPEWESPVDSPHPDLVSLCKQVGRKTRLAKTLFRTGLADQLAPLFSTHFRRTCWQLRLDDGTEAELALDVGTVQYGEKQLPLCEVEIELKSGNPAVLFDFAMTLQETVPLRVSNISKAARGYALISPEPPAIVKAAELVLAAPLSTEQGLQHIVDNCLAHIQGNEAGVEMGHDPESVHQMRIGLRRLRSMLGEFAAVAPFPSALETELQWLAGILGTARDWEVLAGVTLITAADACPDQDAANQLLRAAQAQALMSRRSSAQAVGSIRYARLMLAIGAWVRGARWREALPPDAQKA